MIKHTAHTMTAHSFRWILLLFGLVWSLPPLHASTTTQIRPSRTFAQTAEHRYFIQQINQFEQPWQQHKQRCGWHLLVHFHPRGQSSFRYGPFYRDFVLPNSSRPDVRARTLVLLLGLFWDAVQQEQSAGALSCTQRRTRLLAVSLPGTLPSPPPRPTPKRSRPIPPKPPTPPRPIILRPIPPKPPTTPRPTTPRLITPRPIPSTLPSATSKPTPSTRPSSQPTTTPPKNTPLDFTLGGHFTPYIGFNGNLIWAGSITTLYWAESPWRMRIEATGGRYDDPNQGGQIIAQINALAEWVPWRSRFFSWDIHLGLALIFSWTYKDVGGYLWMTLGLQGGTTFSWHPTDRLTFFLRLDVAYYPFRTPAKDDTSYRHLHDAYLLPILGFSWRF